MNRKKCLYIFVFLMLECSIGRALLATDFYVDQNHLFASDQNAGTMDKPWKTILKANQNLNPGDTVLIRAGTYENYISPHKSGSAASPITYKNYGDDVVTISNTTYAILLDGKSHIHIRGINFHNLDAFLWLQNGANHNIIAYCKFDQARNRRQWSGSKIYMSSSNNWIHNCQFSKYGDYSSGDDRGTVMDIGNEESQTDNSNYNLIENNTMFHGGHHVLSVCGKYNVIRNNYFHNEPWLSGFGNRNVSLGGYAVNSGWNLIEGNRIAYSSVPPDNWGASGLCVNSGYNIIRRNKFYYNNLSGLDMTLTSTYYSDIVYNKIYHNTFLHNGWNMSTGPDALTSAIGFAVYSGNHVIKNNAIKNNIYYSHYQVYGYYNVKPEDQIFEGNWDGDSRGNPMLVNGDVTYNDPMNATYPDLSLQGTSPCIDSGTYLTTITSANGSGKMFQVVDSRYFIDGWGIPNVDGDEIQISGTSQKAKIIQIDYNTHAITVDKNLTWTKNQGISLAYEGSAPDAGAIEFVQNSPIPPKNLNILTYLVIE